METITASPGYYVIDWVHGHGLMVCEPVLVWVVQQNHLDALTPAGVRTKFDDHRGIAGYQMPDGRVWIDGHNLEGRLGFDGQVLLPDFETATKEFTLAKANAG